MTVKSNVYFPALDGLRAISIMLVFLSHLLVYSKITTTSPIPGGLGVTIFFFISGFLITNLLLAEFEKSHEINLKLFYTRRILRLYPPMLLMMICITIFLWITQRIVLYKEILAALFYYENYFLAYHPFYSDKYGILWSLAIEEHFYLLFPFILAVLLKKPKLLFGAVTLLTMIPLVLRVITAIQYHTNDISASYTYELTHCRFDSILYGCLTSILINSKFANRFLKVVSARPVYLASIAVFLFTLLCRDEFFRQTIRYSLQGLSLMCIIPPVIYNNSYSLLQKNLSLKWMVFIGKISYSIYLFHYVAIIFLENYIFKHTITYIILNIILSVTLSLVSYFYLEVPIMKLRKKFGSTVKAKPTKLKLIKEVIA